MREITKEGLHLAENAGRVVELCNETAGDRYVYTYAEICEIMGVEVCAGNVSYISKIARENGVQRRHRTTRVIKPKNIHILSPRNKERFMEACKAFAEVYFK